MRRAQHGDEPRRAGRRIPRHGVDAVQARAGHHAGIKLAAGRHALRRSTARTRRALKSGVCVRPRVEAPSGWMPLGIRCRDSNKRPDCRQVVRRTGSAMPIDIEHQLEIFKRGADELLVESRSRRQAEALAADPRTAAHQARPRPDRAGHPHRAHGRAEQDAPDAGPGAPGDLPDRRFHVDDRRPVRPQRDAPAADARADRGERADLPRAGLEGARSCAEPRSATTPSGASRWAPPG